MNLGPLDAVIILLFLGAIFALGFSARLRQNTTLQFIAAGRALTLPMFVATLVATWYGGILGVGESANYYGLGSWVLIGVPYYVFALVYALVLAKRVRAADQISIPERIANTWGKGPGLIAAALVFLLAVPAAHVLMLGTLTQALTGWDLPHSIVVATFVGSMFLYKGGLLADARVSLLAFVMMYVGFAAISIYCLTHYPIGETWAQFRGTDRFAWDGGVGILAVVSFFIIGAWTLIDPGFHQRVASAKDPDTGRRGVLVAIFCWIVFDVLSVTTAMYALALVTPLPGNTLLLFPVFGDQILPQGLKAVFFCGMLGTILTAMVGYSLVGGATIGREFVCRAFGITDESKATTFTRAGILVTCVVAIPLSMQFKSVVLIWFLWAGAIIGALLIPTMVSYLSKRPERLPAKAVAVSMVSGFIISIAWLIWTMHNNQGRQTVNLAKGVEFDIGTLLPGVAVGALTLAVGTAVLSRSKK